MKKIDFGVLSGPRVGLGSVKMVIHEDKIVMTIFVYKYIVKTVLGSWLSIQFRPE